jgi:glycosyltransferase involved in cell wall biosynthesis
VTLRIAIVTHYPVDPTRISGGIQAVSTRLVAELRQRPDLEVHVIHCHGDVAENRVVADRVSSSSGQNPITLHFLGQTKRRLVPNMVTGISRIAARLREIAPDVVHVHSAEYAVAALRAGYQPIWTIHGILRQEIRQYPGLFDRLSYLLAMVFDRLAVARVRTITAVSPYVVEAYRGTPNAAAWHVIENPAPAGYFELPRRPIQGRVFMPAAVIPLKDPLTLVRAASRLQSAAPDSRIILAGSLANVAYVGEVRREIARLGLGDAVILAGPFNADQLRQAYAEAAVVALPSRQEICPMAIVEAMAAGAAVVASAVGGVPHLVADGVTGRLVPPGDPVTLAEALAALLSRPEIAAALGARGREVARQRFAPARVAEQYIALYRTQARTVQSPVR